jgi:hypothetical protein
MHSGQQKERTPSHRSNDQGWKILPLLGLGPPQGPKNVDAHRHLRQGLERGTNRDAPSGKFSGRGLRLQGGRKSEPPERLEKLHGNLKFFSKKKIRIS